MVDAVVPTKQSTSVEAADGRLLSWSAQVTGYLYALAGPSAPHLQCFSARQYQQLRGDQV